MNADVLPAGEHAKAHQSPVWRALQAHCAHPAAAAMTFYTRAGSTAGLRSALVPMGRGLSFLA